MEIGDVVDVDVSLGCTYLLCSHVSQYLQLVASSLKKKKKPPTGTQITRNDLKPTLRVCLPAIASEPGFCGQSV